MHGPACVKCGPGEAPHRDHVLIAVEPDKVSHSSIFPTTRFSIQHRSNSNASVIDGANGAVEVKQDAANAASTGSYVPPPVQPPPTSVGPDAQTAPESKLPNPGAPLIVFWISYCSFWYICFLFAQLLVWA